MFNTSGVSAAELHSLFLQSNTSSFYFAQFEWVEKSSGHFLQLQMENQSGFQLSLKLFPVTWPSVSAAGGWPQCDLMLSVMSTSFALIVKECFGGKKLHISGLQTLAKFLVSFPYLCKCWKMLKESRRGQKVLVYVLSGTWRLFFFLVSSADSSSQDMLDLNITWRH